MYMSNTKVTSRDDFFYQLKCHMVGMSKELWGENGDRVVAPTEEDKCKNFGTIPTPSINITLKANFLFR